MAGQRLSCKPLFSSASRRNAKRHPGSSCWRKVDGFSLELGKKKKDDCGVVGLCVSACLRQPASQSASHTCRTLQPLLLLSPYPSFLLSLSLIHTHGSLPSQSLLVCFSIPPSSSRIKIGATFPPSSHPPVGQAAETREPRRASVSGFRFWTGVCLRSGNNRVRF